MHIDVYWDDAEHTIICYHFRAGWTLAEFHEAFYKVRGMIQESGTVVIGIIVDDRDDSAPPKNALMAFRRTVREGKLPIALVGLNRNAKVLMDVAEGAFSPSRPIFYTDTLEEARSLLQDFAAQAGQSADEEGAR